MRRSTATATARRAPRSRRRWRPGATCCSTSTGRARSSCARSPATTWSACSSCRRRWPSSSAGCGGAPQDAEAVVQQAPRPGRGRRHPLGRVRLRPDQRRSRRERRAGAAILGAERLRRQRQPGLTDFVSQFRATLAERRRGAAPRSCAASRQKPATSICSARAVGGTPAAASRASGSRVEALEARAQHLAPLAERRLEHALERRLGRPAPAAAAAGVSWTRLEATWGGGTKARAGRCIRMRTSHSHCAITDSRP